MTDVELIEIARQAQKNAYAPYSNFKVGAALLSSQGKIFTGVNVENGSYGLTICAERTAIAKAVSEGHLKFSRIVVYSNCSPPATPCGACRQVLNEFSPDMQVICVNNQNEINRFDLSHLLPESFSFKQE
jgi:cytidine deaminase